VTLGWDLEHGGLASGDGGALHSAGIIARQKGRIDSDRLAIA
jgi:hypothetical protein